MAAVAERVDTSVSELRASVFTVPTDAHESDGTLEWDETTLVLVEVEAGGETGIGWTYGAAAAAKVVEEQLAAVVCGTSALDVRVGDRICHAPQRTRRHVACADIPTS